MRRHRAACARAHKPSAATKGRGSGTWTARHERTCQTVQELALRVERRLRGGSRDLSGGQRQPAWIERAERQRNAASRVEVVHQRVGDVGLIDVKAVAIAGWRRARRRWRCVVQRQIEIGVVAVMGQRGLEVGRQVGVHRPGESAANAAIGGEDGVAPLDVASRRERCRHRRTAQGRRAGDMGEVAVGRIDLDHVGRGRRQHQIARHRQRADRIARRQRAAVDRGVADRAIAAECTARVHRRQRRRRNRTVHRQRAAAHRRRAGVGVETGENEVTGAGLGQ